MTKLAEIAALDAFIATLPEDSYLRPWLEHARPEIVSDIQSDFPVAASIKHARQECDRLLHLARQQADAVKRQAERDAEQIRQQAHRSRDELIGQLRNAINFLCA